jgi:hypothetical protein
VSFEILTAASVKMTAFWDIAPYSPVKLTDVSEVLTASVIRAMSGFQLKRDFTAQYD